MSLYMEIVDTFACDVLIGWHPQKHSEDLSKELPPKAPTSLQEKLRQKGLNRANWILSSRGNHSLSRSIENLFTTTTSMPSLCLFLLLKDVLCYLH